MSNSREQTLIIEPIFSYVIAYDAVGFLIYGKVKNEKPFTIIKNAIYYIVPITRAWYFFTVNDGI
jgi:hypothetical protein